MARIVATEAEAAWLGRTPGLGGSRVGWFSNPTHLPLLSRRVRGGPHCHLRNRCTAPPSTTGQRPPGSHTSSCTAPPHTHRPSRHPLGPSSEQWGGPGPGPGRIRMTVSHSSPGLTRLTGPGPGRGGGHGVPEDCIPGHCVGQAVNLAPRQPAGGEPTTVRLG
eukprot:768694-Hanusia_phi.AAC.7